MFFGGFRPDLLRVEEFGGRGCRHGGEGRELVFLDIFEEVVQIAHVVEIACFSRIQFGVNEELFTRFCV